MKSIAQRTEDFALRIINACVWLDSQLADEKKFTFMELNKQLLRSGTSIGANYQESISAQSDKDYIHKLEIALKEARETMYWLNLLIKSEIAPIDKFSSLLQESDEIIRILVASINKKKSRINN
jgi:four helix bundle protein